ncbi:sulfatase family protein [Inmirania thermothiophila]|uniref:Arylsulfatase A-like enzyme n=1 Tax=Inmirania thermothiophila TaxID=1750597 RepID=A0A3N1XTP4_9GAMM|nr:sulfatase [Inmirania thermothiophila]ROR29628.1 arylsulfatase A-like enzyme [Inmirania thermothiophila]
MNRVPRLRPLAAGSALAALAFTALLTAKSVADFGRTGPAIRAEIEAHYLGYAVYAVGRLAVAAFVIAWLLAMAGAAVQAAFLPARRRPAFAAFVAGGAAIGLGTAWTFARALVHEPGTLVASWLYDVAHLVRLWFLVEPLPLAGIGLALAGLVTLALAVLALRLVRAGRPWPAAALAAVPASAALAAVLPRPGAPPPAAGAAAGRPNIVLIGSDTLRADRLGLAGYPRRLTPHIDALAAQGTWFAETYVPIARTAPSITTLLTGAWPRRHGVTSNFIPDEATRLPVPALPALLREAGYRTAAVGDWAASDVGKIAFGFDALEVSPDQWNLKYLLRQGPKDLRLFVALFTHNAAGRLLLPELYYLAGRPLTADVGRAARRAIDRLAAGRRPFFLLTFIATTHAPFGSEYPYYTLFSGGGYRGRSKFSMTGVFTPEDIARRQAQGAEAFDVQQIVDLYDGAVRRFDDEVGRIVEHLAARGLLDDTIVVVFSDHGTDLFERGTWGQGNTVLGDDPSNRIPLVVVDPRRRGPRTVRATVRSVDLAPTLLELAGLDPGRLQADGRSLVPFMDGVEAAPRAAYFATGAWLARVQGMAEDHLRVPPLLELLEIPDHGTGTIALSAEGRRRIEAARDRAVRYGRWKLVRIPTKAGPRYALYDLAEPQAGDVTAHHPALAACLRRALEAWVEDPAAAPLRPDCGGEVAAREGARS